MASHEMDLEQAKVIANMIIEAGYSHNCENCVYSMLRNVVLEVAMQLGDKLENPEDTTKQLALLFKLRQSINGKLDQAISSVLEGILGHYIG